MKKITIEKKIIESIINYDVIFNAEILPKDILNKINEIYRNNIKI